MARNNKRRSGSGAVTINMTPMIDCTFLLIIFFILTTQIVKDGIDKIIVPKPMSPHMAKSEDKDVPPNVAIVNVVASEKVGDKSWTVGGLQGSSDPDEARQISHYSISGERIKSYAIKTRLPVILKEKQEKAKKAGYDELVLQVRGDAGLPYIYVSAVFNAASRAGVVKMNLTATED